MNGLRTDQYTSLFLRDVTAATGVPSYTSIAGKFTFLVSQGHQLIDFRLCILPRESRTEGKSTFLSYITHIDADTIDCRLLSCLVSHGQNISVE